MKLFYCYLYNHRQVNFNKNTKLYIVHLLYIEFIKYKEQVVNNENLK